MLGSQGSGLTLISGPLEAAGLQALVEQHKAVAFPVQRLDPIPASAAEQEQRVGEWIQRKFLLNQRSQAVDPTAQICIPAGDIHLVSAGEVAQHDCRARRTVSTVAASAPL